MYFQFMPELELNPIDRIRHLKSSKVQSDANTMLESQDYVYTNFMPRHQFGRYQERTAKR